MRKTLGWVVFLPAVLIPFLSGCASHRNVVKLEVTREIVLVPPTIDSVQVEPEGVLDTWEGPQQLTLTVSGDKDLEATIIAREIGKTITAEQISPGVYRAAVDVPRYFKGPLTFETHLRHAPSGAEAKTLVAGKVRFTATEPPPPPKKEVICTAAIRADLESALRVLIPHFDFESADLDDEAQKVLQLAIEVIREHRPCPVVVLGFTDLQGEDELNKGLSVLRAEAARTWLQQRGVSAELLTVKGYGKTHPLDSRFNLEAHRENRRVELHATDPYEGN